MVCHFFCICPNVTFASNSNTAFLNLYFRQVSHETDHTCDSPCCWSNVCHTTLQRVENKQLLVVRGNLWPIRRLPPIDVERKVQLMPCSLKPSGTTFTKRDIFYPFLCSHNFLEMSELHGSFSFELPYGIKRAEKLFQLALSRLDSCGVFTEDERMNNGPVVGYEQDVGRKTSYRLFYPESVFSDPVHYDPNTTAVLVVFKPHDLKWLWDLLSGQRLIRTYAFWKKPALQLIYKPHQIRILDPAITRTTAYDLLHLPTKFAKHERPRHPTTGLIAITFAFQICSEVHLAGFKYNLDDRNSSLHYYGNDTMSQMIQNLYHDIAVEQRFLKELIDRRILINLTEE
ncbi:hypothetical protein JD844_033003 [Phrynosoma platyrhinos]|uniref:Type 2 lactosamine alpha-2,3-sialyltransferase n=1 Tax=Phrynosoma platyrhinos TaxID=52577 RepID=A0ABQ7T6E1_PHRPL|nr:hypothetical protein JD844_033003 [Phrynosoma platyrhinos]